MCLLYIVMMRKRSLISVRQCFSRLRQVEDWGIKVHWFLQPPGHRLKCELWLRPLLEVCLLAPTTPTTTSIPSIHPLPLSTHFSSSFFFFFPPLATFPAVTSVCFGLIAQRVCSPGADRQSSDRKRTQVEFFSNGRMWRTFLAAILLCLL